MFKQRQQQIYSQVPLGDDEDLAAECTDAVDNAGGKISGAHEKDIDIDIDDGDDDSTAILTMPSRSSEDDEEDLSIPKDGTANGKGCSREAVTSSVIWSCCSVSMVLVNKSLASSYSDRVEGSLNILLVVFQAIVAVILVEACRYANLLEDYFAEGLNLDTIKRWAPVNIFFCLMLFTGMASLETNSVPMVTVFKNVANIFIAGGDYFLFGNQTEWLALSAFGVMLAGAVFAAAADVTVTFMSTFWMLANCLSTAGYVLYMKHATQTIKLSKFGMVFVNNLLCLVFLVPTAYFTGEVDIFLQSSGIHTMDYFFKNVFAGGVGFFLNFASLQCVAAAGPTTYAMVGSFNKVPITLLGIFLFHTPLTADAAFFIAVSLAGGFLYSYAKIRNTPSTRQSSPTPPSRSNYSDNVEEGVELETTGMAGTKSRGV